jgi:hypothetical protein
VALRTAPEAIDNGCPAMYADPGTIQGCIREPQNDRSTRSCAKSRTNHGFAMVETFAFATHLNIEFRTDGA